MKKKTLYVIFSIIILLALILLFHNLTGRYTTPGGELKGCADTDGGLNYYERGTVSYENRDYNYTDFCVREAKVQEYYCSPPTDYGRIRSKEKGCHNGCTNGACIR